MRFRNRRDAGRQLAALLHTKVQGDIVVLALPRGGVPVAAEVARELGAPMDVLVARKLGAPSQPELGIGAIAENGAVFLDRSTIGALNLDGEEVERIAVRELQEVHRRTRAYRQGRPLPDLRRQTVLLVDDGIATGGTMKAAIRAVRELGAARIVVAIPVGPGSTLDDLRPEVDDVVCPLVRDDLYAIGEWYDDFSQLSDDQVLEILRTERKPQQPRTRQQPSQSTQQASRCGAARDPHCDPPFRSPDGKRGSGSESSVRHTATRKPAAAGGFLGR
jgi:predicted phosphoribosyltransferase